MGHLGEGTEITTVEDKEIVLTASNGQHFRMKIADMAEAVRQVMPVATSDRNGIMESSVLKSIYSFASIIQPRSTFNTEIKTGGLILVQNSGMVHDIAVAIMYADGRGTVICAAPNVSFFYGSDYIDVRKEDMNESIQIVNNTDVVQHFAFRIICSIISPY